MCQKETQRIIRREPIYLSGILKMQTDLKHEILPVNDAVAATADSFHKPHPGNQAGEQENRVVFSSSLQ